MGAEAASLAIAKELYPNAFDENGNFHRDRLTETQANAILALSSAVGAFVGGVSGGGINDAVIDANIASNAVENNGLNTIAKILGKIVLKSGKIDDVAEKIAKGHSWEKHKSDFPELNSQDEYAQLIDNIMKNPSETKQLANGREAFWDDKTGTVVIKSPNSIDGGTAFKPTAGKRYFNDNLK